MTDTAMTTVYADEDMRKPICTIISNIGQVEISTNLQEIGILELRFREEDGIPKKLFIRQEQY